MMELFSFLLSKMALAPRLGAIIQLYANAVA